MIIKYKNYMGTVEKLERIGDTARYFVSLRDINDININFICDIHDIKIPNVIANGSILEGKE